MIDLSILIPARNEMFLNQTIGDILRNRRGMTEIIVVLDGQWPLEPIPDHERVSIIYHNESVGQRAATNDAARIARGWYVMKVDAHCSFDEGFDIKMLEAFAQTGEDVTMVPIMRNLHVFDWVCPDGHRRYQGHSGPCKECGKPTEREIVWIAKHNPQSTSYCFDSEPHFQYFRDFKKRPEGQPGPDGITETMSLQGSCWMLTKEKYFELNVCDEAFGSWGSQGIEVACKTWLSGGRVVVNHNTWYAHAFRTKGGDWGFPYPLSGRQVSHAKSTARDLFFNNKWPKQAYPLSWLIEKFWPVPGWKEEDLEKLKSSEPDIFSFSPSSAVPVESYRYVSVEDDPSWCHGTGSPESAEPLKGIVYYTDNRLDQAIMSACQRQLEKAGLPIVSVSLKPIEFGENIVVDAERGALTMFKQILLGLEAIDADVVFFAEHDVLYHPSHFDFTPGRDDLFYYNNNVWKCSAEDGRSLFHYSNHTSQLCACRELLLRHYRKRVALVEEHGFSRKMGYEPGTHGRKERVDDYKCDIWMSPEPNIDIRHKRNLTQTRWKRSQFRNKRFTKGWKLEDKVPGWGNTREVLESMGIEHG